MERVLIWIGRAAGVLGVLLCALGAGARLAGQFWLGSFQSVTLLQGGVAAMVFGCLCFLAVLVNRSVR